MEVESKLANVVLCPPHTILIKINKYINEQGRAGRMLYPVGITHSVGPLVLHKLCVVASTCNLSTQEVEAGGSEAEDNLTKKGVKKRKEGG